MFKRDPTATDDWFNNDANNNLDDFVLEDDGRSVFRCKAQTVSNIPGGKFLNTLGVGPFQLRLFVEPRAFYGRIHGICNALTLWGQTVDDHSITAVIGKDGKPISYDRWLMHDWQKHKPNPPGIDTRVAWSAGCIVIPDAALAEFGGVMDSMGMTAGELIDGMILPGKMMGRE